MTEENIEEGAVTIDDVEYPMSEMDNKQLYLVQHLQELQKQKSNLSFQLDRVNVTESGFMKLLKETLDTPEAE